MLVYNRNLKFLRKKKGKTQQEVADALGLPRSTINGFENNPLNPTVENLIKLSDYYGISIDTLLRVDITLLPQSELMKQINS